MIYIFKTELHFHSCEVSACAKATASELVDIYKSAGYSTLVLTNHFASFTYSHLTCESWRDFIDKYLYGYKLLKEIAGDELCILLGVELRPKSSPNDYLIYGIDEQFLYNNEFLYEKSVEELSSLSRSNGFLFIQAHPFRDNMVVTRPDLIDGIEVYNGSQGGHYGTDSRNDISESYAKRFDFIKTSGTDLHYPTDKISGGILTSEKIRSVSELVSVLKSGSYAIIKG